MATTAGYTLRVTTKEKNEELCTGAYKWHCQ